MPLYDVVIPARNEAVTVAAVVAAARLAEGAGRVIVVDDGSSDDTAAVARSAGAEVVALAPGGDKALALAAGVAASVLPVLVFIDGDILNLKPEHVAALAAPVVENGYAMSCGLVDYGSARNPFFLRLPPITGLRAVRRWVFEAIPEEKRDGFSIEIMINEVVARRRAPSAIRVLSGVGHRSKVAKLGWRHGVREHAVMTLQLVGLLFQVPLWTYWTYLRALDVLPATAELAGARVRRAAA